MTGRGSQGAGWYAAENPPFGATITYHLAEDLETRRERRKQLEKDAEKAGEKPPLPSLDELRAEENELEPEVVLTVRDEQSRVVRTLTGPRKKGMHRVTWDLREPGVNPLTLSAGRELMPWESPDAGPLVLPGTYSVTLEQEVDGQRTTLAGPQSFEVVPLNQATLPAPDRAAAAAFQRKALRLARAVAAAVDVAGEAEDRIALCRKAVHAIPGGADPSLTLAVNDLEARLRTIQIALTGDPLPGKYGKQAPPSIQERIRNVTDNQLYTTAAPTQTEHDAYRVAGEAFTPVLADLRTLVEQYLAQLEAKLEELDAPHTRGRIPTWEME